MEKQFANYDLALKLEELGFNKPCLATIDQTEYLHINKTKYPIRGSMCYNEIKAPLYQQVVDWFEETHDIHISTMKHVPIKLRGSKFFSWCVDCVENGYCSLGIKLGKWIGKDADLSYHVCNTRREALMAAIEEAIEILEKRNANKNI